MTANAPHSDPAPAASGLDVNAVVSYNLKAIRRRRGLTQQAVAHRLADFTGHQLPQASISAMERGDGKRRRRFDAHELHLLAVVFDVPIAYFFLPPPGLERLELAGTGRPVTDLYRALLGVDDQLPVLDERLAETQPADAGARQNRFRTWRTRHLTALERNYDAEGLAQLACVLAELAATLKAHRADPVRDPSPQLGPASPHRPPTPFPRISEPRM